MDQTNGKHPIDQPMRFHTPISIMTPPQSTTDHRCFGILALAWSKFWKQVEQWLLVPQIYHAHPNIFEANRTKTPSLFIIESYWYGPKGTNRVDSTFLR